MIKDNIDILLISETKIDTSFPTAQFLIEGFTIYRRDRDANGGGLLLYVREDIPSTLLNIDCSIEGFYVELIIRKKKWLIYSSYNPNRNLISNHLREIGKNIDLNSSKYDNFILLGDFNSEPSEQPLTDFCHIYNCQNIIREKTCFKNPQNPSCIDLIITNRPKCFQGSMVIETGLSDFHKMSLTVMKVFYKKQPPNIVRYRSYKNFDNELFMNDIENCLAQEYHQNQILKFESFKRNVHHILERHAPLKKRYVRANQAPFMNKKINKEIMKRSRLRNKFLNSKSDIDRKAYNKQHNFCVSLIKKAKKGFFSSLNSRDITDNKIFWKTVKPFLTDKIKTKSRITLIEKTNDGNLAESSEEIISDDKDVAEIFNNFFVNIVPNLKIPTNHGFGTDFLKTDEPVLNAINKYKNHPSVVMIRDKSDPHSQFSFSVVPYSEVLKKTKNLNISKLKSTQQTDIPTKILKQNCAYFASYFHENINFCLEKSEFPSDLKLADVAPVYKKKSKSSKDNYRPVSILSNISKVYERCIYDQIQIYFEKILSKYQCGFRKGYNAQHCLIALIEKWKQSVDNGGAFGALLTDLSKAFDCLSHELLIAKLDAYGFDKKSLSLIYNYLSNRRQRVKINDTFSSWSEILSGVPQGSILGPLLFNIFICDMFYFLGDFEIANYANDSTPFSAKKDHNLVVEELQNSSSILFNWLQNNYMKANTEKSHLLLSGKQKLIANIDGNLIESESSQILLGINIDSNLSFENHINNLCKKASTKLNALARIAGYMDLPKRRVIMKSFITSQFGYCPLIWMFHSRALNNKINSIHERALRITYGDRISTFQELLDKDNSVSIHHRNLQVLATEMFKIKNNMAPEFLNEIFNNRTVPYNLRRNPHFSSRNIHSVYNGSESISFLGPKIWDLVPQDIKLSETITIFKNKIKKWVPRGCPCRLCRIYLQNIGFI